VDGAEDIGAERGTGVVDGAVRGVGGVDRAARGLGVVDGATRGAGRVDGATRGIGAGDRAACGTSGFDGVAREGCEGARGTGSGVRRGGMVLGSDPRRESRSVGGEEPARGNTASSKMT
jgi:hypothetical protein